MGSVKKAVYGTKKGSQMTALCIAKVLKTNCPEYTTTAKFGDDIGERGWY